MNRFVKTLLLALVIVSGGWLLYHRQNIHNPSDAWELARRQLGSATWPETPIRFARTDRFIPSLRFESPRYDRTSTVPALWARDEQTLRIASFKLDPASGAGDLKWTADICQQFDLIAIQNHSQLSMSRLVGQLNQRGLDYRYVDQPGSHQVAAIVFNQRAVVLDEKHAYLVNDPEKLFEYEPLVAWFRATGVPDHSAFTFSLANIQLSGRKPDQELVHLGELFRSIRLDGRGEDDVILAGDFFSSDTQLKRFAAASDITAVIMNLPTNTRNDSQLDNLLLDRKATVEYTGQSGVFDFMKRFNMTMVEAMSVSQRMPVWAEFSRIEGHTPGRANELWPAYAPNR